MHPRFSRKIFVVIGMVAFIAIAVVIFALSPKTPGPVAETTELRPSTTTSTDVSTSGIQLPGLPAAQHENDTSGVKTVEAVAPVADEPKVAHELHPARSVEAPGIKQRPIARSEPLAEASVGSARSAGAPSTNGPVDERPALSAITPMAVDAREPTPGSESVATDSSITIEVKYQFAADSISKDVDIGVTTKHGAVVLTGTMVSQDAIEHVKAIAEKVRDVQSVDASALKIATT